MSSSAVGWPVAVRWSRSRSVNRSRSFTTVTDTPARPLTRAASWTAAESPAYPAPSTTARWVPTGSACCHALMVSPFVRLLLTTTGWDEPARS